MKVETHQLKHPNGIATCTISEHEDWILFNVYSDERGDDSPLADWFVELLEPYREDPRRKVFTDLISGEMREMIWTPD